MPRCETGGYTTFSARHGPAALRKYRTNRMAMSKTEADKLRYEPHRAWEQDLDGCFDLVICDECHSLKSLAADASVSVQWLDVGWMVALS